jgi:superfamily II DNA or RNA helicase
MSEDKKPKNKIVDYGKAALALAPVFGAKTILGDVPVKIGEEYLHSSLAKNLNVSRPGATGVAAASTLKRSLGRALGSAAPSLAVGVATAPMYMKGMQLLQSDDRKDKAKGLGLVLGSGAIFQGSKGIGEGYGLTRGSGGTTGKGITKGLRYGGSKIVQSMPTTILMAGAIAAGRKGKDGEEASNQKKFLLPMAVGGASGLTQNLTNDLVTHTDDLIKAGKVPKQLKNLNPLAKRVSMVEHLVRTPSKLKVLLPSGASGLLGGIAGAGLGALLVDLATKKLKKKEKKAFELPSNQANKEVNKRADGVPSTLHDWFKPFPHQQEAVDKLMSNDGKLILSHGTGLGKTAAAIYGNELLRENGRGGGTLVIVPAGLKSNFAKTGLEKFLKNPNYQIVGSSSAKRNEHTVRPDGIQKGKHYTIVSYAMFRRDPKGILEKSGADTIIADEYHKIRSEESSVFNAFRTVRPQVKNFIGLTASLVNNKPEEIASLLTIAEGERLVSPDQFRRAFVRTVGYENSMGGGKKPVNSLVNRTEFVKLTDPRIDYADSSELKGKTMPRKATSFIDVPMSKEQFGLYQYAMRDLGAMKSMFYRRNPSVTLKEAEHVFSQTAQARAISNSLGSGRTMSLEESAKRTPKVKKLLDDVEKHLKKTPDGRVVVYSNLINGGVDVLSAGLTARGLDHGLFIGKGTKMGGRVVTGASRDQDVKNFNANKSKVLVLSSAGAEGLDLPDATGFFSLDGHFNPERILQAEARVRRLGGQSSREPDKRVVEVKRYRSTLPKSRRAVRKMGGHRGQITTDQWAYNTARRKFTQNKEVYDTMSEPTKYVRKWKDNNGKWRYEYPKQSAFKRLKSTFSST